MDEKKREEIALKRFAFISPVINGFDVDEKCIYQAANELKI